ncbi:Uu.00g080980.m01.CDS01 [Anthostomella pinea]|uniref:Uu.00g080980.m01.CDS01 n=1 Tax=Anthostomella pinea TaxID=933095 RepID=A0AAI8VLS1_9PEZI|nr:Uu.00g080980.m01.CDS01 [Anthostomella pinea]
MDFKAINHEPSTVTDSPSISNMNSTIISYEPSTVCDSSTTHGYTTIHWCHLVEATTSATDPSSTTVGMNTEIHWRHLATDSSTTTVSSTTTETLTTTAPGPTATSTNTFFCSIIIPQKSGAVWVPDLIYYTEDWSECEQYITAGKYFCNMSDSFKKRFNHRCPASHKNAAPRRPTSATRAAVVGLLLLGVLYI